VLALLALLAAACVTATEAPPAPADLDATVEDADEDADGDATGAGDGAGTNDDDAPPPAAPGTAAAEGVDRLFVRVEFDVLADEQLDAMRQLDGVAEVSARRADDVALFGSTRSDGTIVDDLPPDFKVSVAGVVDDTQVGLGLGPGEVAMTATGLQFRDLDVGSRVELAGGVTAIVVQIADDPALDRHELVVSEADAATIGVRGRQRASVLLTPEAALDPVVAAVSAIVGENGIVQARPAGETGLVLPLPRTKELFGEFAFRDLAGRAIEQGVSFTREHIVTRDVPFFGRITCHEDVFDPLIAALQQIRDEGLGDEIVPGQYAGCWTPRRINRNANLSRHAWGIAVDINVDPSAPGFGPVPSEGVIAAFEEHGFVWGGDYPIPDNHHFEYHGERED
jgi:hypothetical protein